MAAEPGGFAPVSLKYHLISPQSLAISIGVHDLTFNIAFRQRGGNQLRARPKTNAAPTVGRFDYSLPPDKDPPVGYICYRCGQKGAWG